MSTDFSCDQAYRNGSKMGEEPENPHVYDTVDWFARARRDFRVVRNQLDLMRVPRDRQDEP